ncbi:hypothetical protein U9M48_015341 [Paspalum notatum var. saurae]|uniref:Uncharacterized protein n=1 Tax=Paspalum notatum var. saurae TaxID=547442 RepID=A0AAQ3T4N5_PASNO
MEGLSLIDVSAEDDLLFDLASPAPPRPDPTHAGSLVATEAATSSLYTSGGGSASAAGGRDADPDSVTEEQAAPERAESPKQRKPKTGVNLRKSLAWDSAFFTSEGVLDTEELAIVNSTFRKTQGSRLPGIMEEMRKSGDSTTSTLENEPWVMESLETELFDNVRASIQRSLGKADRVPGRPAAGLNPPKPTANVPRIASRKGVDRMPQPKIRAPVSTSQGVGEKQRPQDNLKVNLPGAAEAKASKPPRALPRVATMRSSTNTAIASGISDKRSSTGGVANRQAAGKTANTSATVRSGGGTKSSSILKSGPSAPTSSFRGVSMDTKPESKTKSATLSKKNMTAQRVPVRSSSKSDINKAIPSRSKNKIPARGHADRASPSISPCSSVESMSSVISGASTASTVGKMSHTSDSLNTLSPSLRKSNGCHPSPKLGHPVANEGHSFGIAASGDYSKPPADITSLGKCVKPSGLRRPTPKIGYFDSEKSIDQNTGAQVQLQPTKMQHLLPVTPKTQPPTQNISAPHEETSASKSKVVRRLPSEVAQMEVEPFKVAEPFCTHQANPVVAKPEAVVESVDQNVGAQTQTKIQCLQPATPNSQPPSAFAQQEPKPIAAPHEEVSACKNKTVEAVPLEAAQIEVESFKVAEPEASTHQVLQCSDPSTLNPEVSSTIKMDKFIDQNIGPQVLQCSHPATLNPEVPLAIKMVPSKDAPALMDVEALSDAEPEMCMHKTEPVVTADPSKENIPALHQNIQANVDASSLVELLTQKLSSISLWEGTPNNMPS